MLMCLSFNILWLSNGRDKVDWRDFFPYLQLVPNKAWEDKIKRLAFHRKAMIKELLREQKKRISAGQDLDIYTDFLLREAKTLSEGKHDEASLFQTMAFGGGKRLCAGALQASSSSISCAMIGRLVQDFEWRLMDGEKSNVDTFSLPTIKLHPMLVALKPRRSKEITRPP